MFVLAAVKVVGEWFLLSLLFASEEGVVIASAIVVEAFNEEDDEALEVEASSAMVDTGTFVVAAWEEGGDCNKAIAASEVEGVVGALGRISVIITKEEVEVDEQHVATVTVIVICVAGLSIAASTVSRPESFFGFCVCERIVYAVLLLITIVVLPLVVSN